MTAVFGLLLGLVSGVMTGSFSLPMKKTTRWAWEATWLVWSIVALLLIPCAIAFITVPDVLNVLANASPKDITLVFAFGVLWGLGAVFFGQSISMIGISLAFALCIGLSTALGSLIPMLKDPSVFLTSGGIWATAGIAIIVLAVSVCAVSGHYKEKYLQALTQANEPASSNSSGGSRRMLTGLTLGALGGILSSMLNLAYNFSENIKEVAIEAGASVYNAADPVWAVTLLGGLVTNVIYCAVLLTRNKTWSDYGKAQTSSHWFLAALMGAIWMPSIALYGRAAVLMGDLGGSAGWGLYMGMVIVVSNVWGFFTGEWKGVRGKPVNIMIIGIVLLLVAIATLGYGTTQ